MGLMDSLQLKTVRQKKASIQFNIYLEVLKLDFPLIVDVGDHGWRSR